ncbi:MHYT domain-containing protein [Nocardia thailandica]
MAEVLADAGADPFGLGFGVAILAAALSVIGSLVAFACVGHSRYSHKFRVVWLAAAAVSLGGVGQWLANSVALLGLRIPGTQILYTPSLATAALAVSVAGALGGLLLAGTSFDLRRLVAGGLTMGLASGLSTYLTLDALAIRGRVSESLWLIGAASLVAMLVSTTTLWMLQSVRRLRLRLPAALVFAAGVAATYYLAFAALDFHVDPEGRAPGGLTLFAVVFPMFVLGTLGLTLPITAVLIAPDRRDQTPQTPTRPARPAFASAGKNSR